MGAGHAAWGYPPPRGLSPAGNLADLHVCLEQAAENSCSVKLTLHLAHYGKNLHSSCRNLSTYGMTKVQSTNGP